ncbi:F18O14.18 [Arabidopsis thaliana]|uniref:F18O14.18 n=1 Tax=Arabidopsis thaliana TaxID=3702 RepID=Q9LN52_ARATH|nr:F18O14.18 [Arabidopsis thaliana]
MGFSRFSPYIGLKHLGISISPKSSNSGFDFSYLYFIFSGFCKNGLFADKKRRCKSMVISASLFGVGAPEALVIGSPRAHYAVFVLGSVQKLTIFSSKFFILILLPFYVIWSFCYISFSYISCFLTQFILILVVKSCIHFFNNPFGNSKIKIELKKINRKN